MLAFTQERAAIMSRRAKLATGRGPSSALRAGVGEKPEATEPVVEADEHDAPSRQRRSVEDRRRA